MGFYSNLCGSQEGWGVASCNKSQVSEYVTQKIPFQIGRDAKSQGHSLLELKGVFLTLQCFTKDTHNSPILFHTDNQVAITYINKRGGDKVQSPMRSGLETVGLVHPEKALSRSLSPTRTAKHQSRLRESPPNRSLRLTPGPSSLREDNSSTGKVQHRQRGFTAGDQTQNQR